MQFSKDSTKCMKHLLNEFSKSVDKDINKKSRSVQNEMDQHLSKFFNSILESYKVVKSIKKSSKRFSSVLSKIKIPEQIPKSHLFVSEFVSHSIKKYIDDHATIDLCYKFVIHSVEYKVHFVLLDEKEMIAPEKYEKYIEKIMMWLHMAHKYVSGKCANKSLTLYFYLTPFEKALPECSISIIGPENVNSGISYTCRENGEIMIFRQEEWFKVFIHETFHALGLDFSTMNQDLVNKKMKCLFPVETEVNLFEAYTECWARIINCLFISFFTLRNKKIEDKEEFIVTVEYCLQFEANFSVFQMVKVLQCMGLSYDHLYAADNKMELTRKLLYKENTNVFSYYIITSILISHYTHFFSWCHENNLNFIEFTKTISNLQNFYILIERVYLSTKYLNYVVTYEGYLSGLTNVVYQNNTSRDKKISDEEYEEKKFLFNTARMTICEME